MSYLLRELRLEQERLRDQLAGHAEAMERVQLEAEAAKMERDRAQLELRRVQDMMGGEGGGFGGSR